VEEPVSTPAGDVCDAPADVDWLDADPSAGSTPAAGSSDVTVTFDATGLSAGTYEANLCLASNDPDEALVVVPIELTVEEEFTLYLPLIKRDP
jgi:hypothetical protein